MLLPLCRRLLLLHLLSHLLHLPAWLRPALHAGAARPEVIAEVASSLADMLYASEKMGDAKDALQVMQGPPVCLCAFVRCFLCFCLCAHGCASSCESGALRGATKGGPAGACVLVSRVALSLVARPRAPCLLHLQAALLLS